MTARVRLDPAHSVIAVLGGVSVVSTIAGVDRTQVWRWTQPKTKGGTDGRIPSEHHGTLLSWAEDNGKPLTAEMIIRGVPEVFRSKPDQKEAAA